MEESYSLSFGFKINTFWVYWTAMMCFLMYLIFKIIKLKKKHQKELDKKEARDNQLKNSAGVVEIAQFFIQLKDIGYESLVKDARHLIADASTLEMILTDTILRVIHLDNIKSKSNIYEYREDIESLNRASQSYLIILTSNQETVYGLHMGIQNSKLIIEVHNKIYLPFKSSDCKYSFINFLDLQELERTLINITDMYLPTNDSNFIDKLNKKTTIIESEAKASSWSLSGSRDFSKHFWQPDIKIINLEIEQKEVVDELK